MELGLKQQVLLGPPGTGKTTSIIGQIEEALGNGIQPEEIAFVSFTRKAVQEAIGRACQRFNLKPKRFPYFQTVHSLCFRQLGLTKTNLLNRQNFIELGNWLGYDLTGQVDMGDGILASGAAPGDKFLFLDNLARARCLSVRECWEEEGFDIAWHEQERFSSGYARFKDRQGLMDFTDMLHRYMDSGQETRAKLAFVDEAQDLSRAQWGVLERSFRQVPLVTVAGDDDQSIYKWSGADLDTFLALGGDHRVLSHSYRLPRKIHKYAHDIIKGTKKRYKKEFSPADKDGEINYVNELEHVDINPDEKTLILVRNTYLLNQVYEHVRKLGCTYTGRNGFSSVSGPHTQAIVAWEQLRKGNGVTLQQVKDIYEQLRVGPVLARGGKARVEEEEDDSELYTYETLVQHYGLLGKPVWHEALQGIPLENREYYVSVLRSKRRISTEPNIHINTIHSVKGGEAQHVIILSDMSKRTYMEMQKDMDSEYRVAYVAATRASEKLTIVMPRSKYSFPY